MSHTLLTRSGLDLSLAVFLAEASQTAYADASAVTVWAKSQGFSKGATSFNRSNVQGFWCVEGDVALLAFRGTQNIMHWIRNVRVAPWKHTWGYVHRGFLDGVNDVEVELQKFDAAIVNAKHVWVTGHSLGGAMAVIAAARLKIKGFKPFLYTYGQPKMCFSGFADRFAIELPGRYVRFVNQDDIVPRVPPFYSHFGLVKRIVRPGVLESIQQESLAMPSAEVASMVTNLERITMKTTLESAEAVAASGIDQALLIDAELPPLNDKEFLELQMSLGAGETGLEPDSPELEGFFPSIKDHAISEYIRLLTEIRDLPGLDK